MNVPYFDSTWDSKDNTAQKSYLVCCLPRSGSNLLCYSLIEHGNAGMPLEYFNPSSKGTHAFLRRIFNGTNPLPKKSPNFEASKLRDFITNLQLWRTDTNGVWGSKIFGYRYISYFEEQQDTPESFFNDNLKIIYLFRKDKIAQVISNYFSLKTLNWSSFHGEIDSVPKYSFEEIYKIYRTLCKSEEDLKELMSSKSSEQVLFLSYKDLVTNYRKTIKKVYEFLDISPKQLKPPPIQRQSHIKKKEYCRRFAKDLQQFEQLQASRSKK